MKTTNIGLAKVGINNSGPLYRNLSPPELIERSLHGNEATLAQSGALRVTTGQRTGRSPNDKFVVDDLEVSKEIWWGASNRPFTSDAFERLRLKMTAYLQNRPLYVFDGFAGTDPRYRLPIRVINELAWQNLFAHQLFVRPSEEELKTHSPEFTVIAAPNFKADPNQDETNSEGFILLSLARKLILIGGIHYAGEIKKSIFTVMNYLLPLRNVMPMHCSANSGVSGDVALFFGLSGTGKTTLSSDPDRHLIGDDEHGWTAEGVFNFEGGCYAKMIRLSAVAEPDIYATTRRFGTVLENVVIDPVSRALDLDDDSLTENTRGAYPISFIDNWVPSGRGKHPSNIVMLTADAFGVLPPISRLSAEGAMYHFLSGYTAKVAGTEIGVTEPKATFSACFGAPFMVHHPTIYAKLLGERIAMHDVKVWLVNTGWSGGPYGVGSRIDIKYTRAMIAEALSGGLDDVIYESDLIFNVEVPTKVPGIPTEVLFPRATWANAASYDAQSRRLAEMFAANFKSFAGEADEAVIDAGLNISLT